MMYGWDDGMGVGAWLAMTFAWVALVAVIVWAIARLLPAPFSRDGREPARETPGEILGRRLARGEIDTAEYTRLRDALRDAAPSRESA